jgi:hypothetical protein
MAKNEFPYGKKWTKLYGVQALSSRLQRQLQVGIRAA